MPPVYGCPLPCILTTLHIRQKKNGGSKAHKKPTGFSKTMSRLRNREWTRNLQTESKCEATHTKLERDFFFFYPFFLLLKLGEKMLLLLMKQNCGEKGDNADGVWFLHAAAATAMHEGPLLWVSSGNTSGQNDWFQSHHCTKCLKWKLVWKSRWLQCRTFFWHIMHNPGVEGWKPGENWFYLFT